MRTCSNSYNVRKARARRPELDRKDVDLYARWFGDCV
jgi:hypothetical protein